MDAFLATLTPQTIVLAALGVVAALVLLSIVVDHAKNGVRKVLGWLWWPLIWPVILLVVLPRLGIDADFIVRQCEDVYDKIKA